jgi:hypothetical protein
VAVVPLNAAGVATFTTSSLSIGKHNIFARYAGNSQYNSSSSNVVTQTVTASTSSTLLALQPVVSPLGQWTNPQPFSVVATLPLPQSGRRPLAFNADAESRIWLQLAWETLAKASVVSSRALTMPSESLAALATARALDVSALERFFGTMTSANLY